MIFNVSDTSYDRFMGRYSVRLAPVFADFAGVGAGQHVVDIGAGTGALTAELAQRVGADNVAAAEPSPPFVAALRERMPGVDAREGPAEELPWTDGTFDAALAQLVVSFMRDAPTGVGEMRRVTREDGVVAVCMWDRDEMGMFAAINRAREAVAPDSPERSGMNYRTREDVAALLEQAGLRDVETAPLDVEADYTGFDDFWTALASGVGPAGQWVQELREDQRAALPDELHRQLGEPSGPFTLSARAWGARGRV
jgi:ubiquinone/menaquinone biosynthesis C-methylase UbiE